MSETAQAGTSVREQAMLVAKWLRTEHINKKHGGYDIYEDSKIRVSLDTYVPNISIKIRGENEPWQLVFSCSYDGRVAQHNPGHWEAYLASLVPTAVTEEADAKKRWAERDAAEQKRRFGPAADAALFGEDS